MIMGPKTVEREEDQENSFLYNKIKDNTSI